MLGLVTAALAAFALVGYLSPQTLLAVRLTEDLAATANGAAATIGVISGQWHGTERDERITAALTPALRINESMIFWPRDGDGPLVMSTYRNQADAALSVARQALTDPERNVFTVDGADYEVAVRSTSDGQLVVVTPQHYGRGNLYGLLAYQAALAGLLLILLFTVGVFVVRRGLRPLDAIVDTATAITHGERGKRIPLPEGDTEVGRVSAALNQMLDETQASEARLRQFIADASHELRTPLASVRSYAELLRTGAASTSEQRELAVNRIESQSVRMGELVEDLLLLARLDMGRPLRREEVDLATLARDVVHDEDTIDPEHPRNLTVLGPTTVCGDAGRLRQVLTNLLANARVHTPAGTSVNVLVDGSEPAAVRLVVDDDGPGLAGEHLGRVFERFYQADNARSGPGSGLGLSIVEAVTRAHGGTVHADNVPGRGARFTIVLPRGTSFGQTK
jgi:two-component system OmpR family sensor kinase